MFEYDRHDHHGPDGLLEGVTIEWTERNKAADTLLMLFVAFSAIVGVVAALIAMLSSVDRNGSWVLPTVVAVAAFSPLFWFPYVGNNGKPRELVFNRDGTIEAPLGLPFFKEKGLLKVRQSAIVSFGVRQTSNNAEARSSPYSQGVAMYTRDGGTYYVARRLHHDDAHTVAVMLTAALADIREAAADYNAGHVGVTFGNTRERAIN